ncbi:TraB/GumN family protein [Erythrobacter aquimaris]|uniref:TraB/GumN family protein n=1 Tax=Qipengyuania aquimaris TaxID=255984 RepID=A0A6I4TIR3_9SPHN|nr:TraB/GumN family protein [Qipengyuania aquimaris]MXO95784.1 TraB/GumN family protein [Qipengyuania aquimaris]
MARWVLLLLTSIALASCQGEADEDGKSRDYPALWEITGAEGRTEGWLFGTVHALPRDLEWQSAKLEEIVETADMLVVEVSGLDDRLGLEELFRSLAYDAPPSVPIYSRLDPLSRDQLRAIEDEQEIESGTFDAMETWGAALALAEFGRTHSSEFGADKVLLAKFGNREIVELEGAALQLSIFDRLPEQEQRDLLRAIIEVVAKDPGDRVDLATIWSRGDLSALERTTLEGLLADPELNEALLVRRNSAWAAQIENLLSASDKPLIAVGAGHLLGEGSVQSLLEERGFAIRRIQ